MLHSHEMRPRNQIRTTHALDFFVTIRIPSFPTNFQSRVALSPLRKSDFEHLSDEFALEEAGARPRLLMMYIRFIELLLLLAFTHSYIWTKKKLDEPDTASSTGRARRRVRPGSKYAKEAAQKTTNAPYFNTEVEVFLNGDWNNGVNVTISSEDCAWNVDLSEIIAPRAGFNGNCSLHTFYGRRIRSCEDAMKKTTEGKKIVMHNLFIVPQGRFFMLPARHIGEVMYMNHIDNKDNSIIQLEVLSVEPRIFKIRHFVSAVEASGLIANAKAITAKGHKLQRTMVDHIDVTVGSDVTREIDEFHTSDSALDSISVLSQDLQTRLFELLGMAPYQPQLSDGFQISRYNITGAYKAHMDYIDPETMRKNKDKSKNSVNSADSTHTTTENSLESTRSDKATATTDTARYVDEHDYDSGNTGHNRYATLLLYLKEAEVGGETVFSRVDPVYSELVTKSEEYLNEKRQAEQAELALREAEEVELIELALAQPGATPESVDMDLIQTQLDARKTQRAAEAYLQQHHATQLIPSGSWEHDLVGTCRTQLLVKPKVTEGVLFYSQDTFGKVDKRVERGSCPVIQGELWTARLHLWNGPVNGYWARDTTTNEIVEKRFIHGVNSDTSGTSGTSYVDLSALTDATTSIDGAVTTTTSVSNKDINRNVHVPQEISITFNCVDVEGAQLFWEDQLWELLVPGRVLKVNSYYGHKWHLERNNVRLLSWVIQKEAVLEISSKTLGLLPDNDEL